MPENLLDTTHSDYKGQLISWATAYDRLVSVIMLGAEGRFRRRIIDVAEISSGQRVLDVGCGTGTLALEAAEAVGADGRVDGIDPSPKMLARAVSKAKAKGLQIDFQEAGIEALPFPDRSFDHVLSSLMFHHLNEDLKERGLSEIRRVLRPSGRLTIIDFSGHGPLVHRLAAHFAHNKLEEHNHSDSQFEQLVRLTAATGFQDVTSATFTPCYLNRLSASAGRDA